MANPPLLDNAAGYAGLTLAPRKCKATYWMSGQQLARHIAGSTSVEIIASAVADDFYFLR
jgi:hypothetical protein